MKSKLIAFIVLSCLSTTAFAQNTPTDTNIKASESMMTQSMNAMSGMHTLKLTGVPSIDFIAGMLPHHEGAIVMSESILPKLTNQKIHALALSIIKSQKEQVAFMKKWLKDNPFSPSDKVDMKASQEMMAKSLKIMHGMHTVKLTGNPNIDFVEGMIPHHEAAEEMAISILPYLKNKEIINFAKEIIKEQQAQVIFMKEWLKENK